MFDRRLWNRNFVLINLCTALASFTNFSYIYILPVHVLRIGGTNTDVGLMGAGLTAFGLLTRLVMSPLIDRWGRKPMLMLGICLFAATSLGYWILRDSVACMIIMRCVSGFSQGILFPVPPTCVSDVSPRERLVDALGIFGISSALPAILSPVAGLYLYEHVSVSAFFLVTGATALLSVLAAVFYRDPYTPQPRRDENRKVFRLSAVIETAVLLPCLVFFFNSFGFSAVNNFVIAFGESAGIAGISLYFTVHNAAIVTSRLLAGRLSRFLPRKKLIVLGLFLAGLGILIIGFANSMLLLILSAVTIALGGTVFSQYLQADMLSRVAENRRGVVNSGMMLFQDVGAGIGAATFGLTAEHGGYPLTFLIAGAVAAIAIPVSLKDNYAE